MIEIKRDETITTKTLTGNVSDVAALPDRYSSVSGRAFRPDRWIIRWDKEGDGPWKLDHFAVTGPIILKTGKISETLRGRWYGTYEMDAVDREYVSWLAELIDTHTPTD